MDRCEIPRCRAEASIIYLERGVCERHWTNLSSESAPPDALRLALSLPVGEAKEETVMDDGTTKKATTEATTKAAPAKSRKARATKKKTAKSKEPRAKRERIPDDQLCVFAFRTTKDLRDELHRASGPAGASRFAVSAITAAIRNDKALFEELATQAKGNTK